MPEKTFEPGDIVELKSGGPLLTVTDVTGDAIEATWFTEAGERKEGTFDPITLQGAETPGARRARAMSGRR
ncbi:MAG: DUF2158 domain-containing protein [Actinomycetia bacterium]|nr:DUF2158 domain-containing protein [Actinomycetes bacterium]